MQNVRAALRAFTPLVYFSHLGCIFPYNSSGVDTKMLEKEFKRVPPICQSPTFSPFGWTEFCLGWLWLELNGLISKAVRAQPASQPSHVGYRPSHLC